MNFFLKINSGVAMIIKDSRVTIMPTKLAAAKGQEMKSLIMKF